MHSTCGTRPTQQSEREGEAERNGPALRGFTRAESDFNLKFLSNLCEEGSRDSKIGKIKHLQQLSVGLQDMLSLTQLGYKVQFLGGPQNPILEISRVFSYKCRCHGRKCGITARTERVARVRGAPYLCTLPPHPSPPLECIDGINERGTN